MIADKQGSDRRIVRISCRKVSAGKDSLAGVVAKQRLQPQLRPVFPFHGGIPGVIQDIDAAFRQEDAHGPGTVDLDGLLPQRFQLSGVIEGRKSRPAAGKRVPKQVGLLIPEEREMCIRDRHKGQWEFGCAKAVINKSIGDRIKEEYKQDFGIDIEPVYDENRTIKEPIPIALYNVEHKIGLDNNNRDKGIITLAEIKGDYNIEDFQSTEKHDRVQWITKEELSDIETKFPRHVPDFEQTLSIAFKRIEEFYGKTRDERTL